MDEVIKKLKNKKNLNFEESKSAFESIMSGKVKEEQIHDFLTFSSAKGETSDEIAGGVYVLRNKAAQVNVPDGTIDTCGTGGDGKNTLNISTAAALLLSSFRVKVAKHGNKSVSSKCGSADVLEKLNINIFKNLSKVNQKIIINNNNQKSLILLCNIDYNKKMAQDKLIDNKIQKLAKEIENELVETWKKEFKFLISY